MLLFFYFFDWLIILSSKKRSIRRTPPGNRINIDLAFVGLRRHGMYGEVLRELQVLCVILASSDVAREYSIVGSQLVTRHCSAKNWIPTPTSGNPVLTTQNAYLWQTTGLLHTAMSPECLAAEPQSLERHPCPLTPFSTSPPLLSPPSSSPPITLRSFRSFPRLSNPFFVLTYPLSVRCSLQLQCGSSPPSAISSPSKLSTPVSPSGPSIHPPHHGTVLPPRLPPPRAALNAVPTPMRAVRASG